MKRILLFALASLPVFAGSDALAQTFPEASTAENPKIYKINSYNRGGCLTVQNTTELKHINPNGYSFWRIEDAPNDENGGVYIYNMATGTAIGEGRAMSETPKTYYILANGVNDYGVVMSTANPISGNNCIDANINGDGTGDWRPSSGDWQGTTWVFEPVGEAGNFVLTPATLADGANNHHFDSEVITLPQATNKIRFTVLATNTGASWDGHVFFTLAEFNLYKADGTAITLTADNFSTNAQQSTEGPIAGICDGDKTTFFHSRYSGTSVGAYHYIEVTLPEPVQSFKFSFDGRDNKANVPAAIVISDADEAAKLDALNGLNEAISNTQGYNFGSTLNNYASSEAFATALSNANNIKNNSEATVDEINAARTALETATANLQINLPADGQFIRVRATNDSRPQMPYLSSINSTVTDKTDRAAFSPTGKTGEGEATTIFYYTGGKLLAYSNGFYLANNGNFAGYNGVTEGTSVSFAKAANGAKGCYNVKFNNNTRFLFTQTETVDGATVFYTDAGGTASLNGYNFWLEEVPSLPVTITEAGYATFYTPVAVTIPEGLEVYTGTVTTNNTLQLTAVEGNTLPAGSAVILKGNPAKYNFTITTSEATAATSSLTGLTASINKPEGNVYTLQSLDDVVGMYRYTGETLAGFKAYLQQDGAAVAGFRFGGTATGIEGIFTAADGKSPAAVYDLSGRRVERPTKGLYIVNGQKVLFK